jgi:plastocyanin
MNIRPANGRPATFNFNVSGPGPFGSSSFNSTTTINANSFNRTIMSSGPLGSLTFNLSRSFSFPANNLLMLNRSLSLTGTINGQPINFSTSGSTTVTAAQLATAVLAQQIRSSQMAALQQAQLTSAFPGYGFPRASNSYAMPGYGSYMMPGYGYGMQGYGAGSYGGGASQADGMGTAPGMRVGGYEGNRPAQENDAVNRLLSASGVTDEEGRPLWPVGLSALPGDRAAQLRDQVAALLTRERDQAANGAVTDSVSRDLTSAVDSLRKQLLRDKDERFSLTYQAYDDAEEYLGRLKHVSKQLAEASKAVARELQTGKSGGQPEAREAMQVGLSDNRFEPASLTVPVGTTVQWTNHGKHGHTVTSDKGDWGSNELGPSGVYSYTFSRPGTYTYHCKIHADQMRGTIIVK